jgi:hypothetical protein
VIEFAKLIHLADLIASSFPLATHDELIGTIGQILQHHHIPTSRHRISLALGRALRLEVSRRYRQQVALAQPLAPRIAGHAYLKNLTEAPDPCYCPTPSKVTCYP